MLLEKFLLSYSILFPIIKSRKSITKTFYRGVKHLKKNVGDFFDFFFDFFNKVNVILFSAWFYFTPRFLQPNYVFIEHFIFPIGGLHRFGVYGRRWKVQREDYGRRECWYSWVWCTTTRKSSSCKIFGWLQSCKSSLAKVCVVINKDFPFCLLKNTMITVEN